MYHEVCHLATEVAKSTHSHNYVIYFTGWYPEGDAFSCVCSIDRAAQRPWSRWCSGTVVRQCGGAYVT